MVLDRGSINIIEKAIRRVAERLRAGENAPWDMRLIVALEEIADEIARIASGKDERSPSPEEGRKP